MAKSMAVGPVNSPDESINVPKRQSHDFSISNMTTNENMEMSFDETMGSMSMSMIQNQMNPGKGLAGEEDSLQVQMLKGELEQARDALESREAEIEELKVVKNNVSDQSNVEVPIVAVTDVDSVNEKLIEAKEDLKKEISIKEQLQSTVDNLQKSEEELKNSLAQQSSDLDALKAENEKLSNNAVLHEDKFPLYVNTEEDEKDVQLKQAEQDLMNETISKDSLKSTVEDFKKSEETFKTNLDSQENEIQQLKLENESLKSNCESLAVDKEALEAQISKSSETIEALRSEESSNKETKADFESQSDNVQSLETQISNLESQISEKDAGIKELESRLESTSVEIQELKQTNEGSLSTNDNLIQSKNEEITTLKEKLIEYERKCQSLDEIVQKKNDLSRVEVEENREIKEADFNIKIQSLNEALQEKVDEILVERNAKDLLDTQIEQLQNNLTEKSSELEMFLKTKESMMGSESELQKVVEEKEIELNKLIVEKKHDQELFEQCLHTTRAERDSAKQLVEEYEGKLDQISATEQKLAEINEQHSKLDESNKNLKCNFDDVCAKIKIEKENNQLLKEELEKSEMEQGEVNEELKKQVEDKDSKIERGIQRLQELEEKLAQLDNIKKRIEVLKEKEDSLLEQVANFEADTTTKVDMIETLQSDLNQAQHELSNLREEKLLITSEAESSISEARLKEETMEKQNLELSEELKIANDRLAETNARLSEKEDDHLQLTNKLREQLATKEDELEQKTQMVTMENDEKNKLLQVKIDDLESITNDTKEELATLASEKRDLASQLEKIKDQMTNSEDAKMEMGVENETLKLTIEEKEEEAALIKELLEKLENALKENEASFKEMQDDKENALEALQTKEKEMAEKLDEATAETQCLKLSLDDLMISGEQVKSDLHAQISDLKMQESERNSEIVRLNQDIATFQEEVNKFKQVSSQHEEENSFLQEKVIDLESLISNGRLEFEKVCLAKDDLNCQIENIKEQFSQSKEQLETENSQCKSKLIDLENNLENAQHELEGMEKQKEDASNQCSELEEQMNDILNEKTTEIELQKNKIAELELNQNSLKLELDQKVLELKEKEGQFNNTTEILKERLSKMESEIKLKDEEAGLKHDEQKGMLKAKLDSLEGDFMNTKIELQTVLSEKSSALSQLQLSMDKHHAESLELNKVIKEGKEIEAHKKETINRLEEELRKALFEIGEVERQRDMVDEECNKLENQLKEKSLESDQVNPLQARVEELESSEKRWKFEAEEVEKQRDVVDAECDRLEAELETTKNRLEAELEETKTKLEDLSRAATPEAAGQATLLDDISMECTYAGNAPVGGKGVSDLTAERDELKSELVNLKVHLKSLDDTNEKYQKLRTQLFTQKEYGDRMYQKNRELQQQISAQDPTEINRKQEELMKELAKVKEDLGQQNIAYASLKVDVEKEELKYKKKCTVLEGDLEYEKKNSTRLTQELRRLQSEKMDTTVLGNGRRAPEREVQQEARTPAAVQSPVWSNGAGVIKEIILQELEVKSKRLQKENSTLKNHEEFYINKAREWKNWALKYEKVLKTNNVPYESREAKQKAADAEAKEASAASSTDTENVPPPLQDLINVAEGNVSRNTTGGPRPPTPTQNMKLVLSRSSGPAAYRKEASNSETASKDKPDDCKTQ